MHIVYTNLWILSSFFLLVNLPQLIYNNWIETPINHCRSRKQEMGYLATKYTKIYIEFMPYGFLMYFFGKTMDFLCCYLIWCYATLPKKKERKMFINVMALYQKKKKRKMFINKSLKTLTTIKSRWPLLLFCFNLKVFIEILYGQRYFMGCLWS